MYGDPAAITICPAALVMFAGAFPLVATGFVRLPSRKTGSTSGPAPVGLTAISGKPFGPGKNLPNSFVSSNGTSAISESLKLIPS